MTDTPNDFAAQLKARRLGRKLSVRQAATRSGLSAQRWSQVEQGYQLVGGEPVPTKPSERFVVRAAGVLGWDVHDALAEAGIDPSAVVVSEAYDDTAPRTLEDLWAKLNDQQRAAIFNLARVMVDPETIIDSEARGTGKRPVPRLVFSAEEDEPGTGQ